MSFLGRFLVEQGAVSQEQLEDGLRFQREHNRRIGEVAMDRGVLSADQVLAIRDRQRMDPRLFGDIAVGERQMSRRALDELLFFQKVQHVYLGEALLLRGHINRSRYEELMGRYWALRQAGRVNLRYLQDFFAENRIAEIFFTAVSRAVSRLACAPLEPTRVGESFDWAAYPVTAVVSGRVLDGRLLEVGLGFDEALAAGLAARPEGAALCDTILRYFGDLLRDASLRLTEPSLDRPGRFDHPRESCLFLRGATPCGELALAFWLAEDAA